MLTRRASCTLGAVLIVCWVNACVTTHDASGDGRAGVERFNHALDSATRNMDNAATLALWDSDGVSLLPQTEPIVGKKAITAFLEKAMAGIAGSKMEKFEMQCFDIQISGASATEWCDEHQIVELPGNKKFDGRGRMDFVLRRSSDNSWRMVREMWQPALAPR